LKGDSPCIRVPPFMISLPPPELVQQLIDGVQKGYYSWLSAWMMFMWDYGELAMRIYSNETLKIPVQLSHLTKK